MGKASYSKLAVITGVLENIKQEFYRRVGEPYEDKKIRENGDIREYVDLKKEIKSKVYTRISISRYRTWQKSKKLTN